MKYLKKVIRNLERIAKMSGLVINEQKTAYLEVEGK